MRLVTYLLLAIGCCIPAWLAAQAPTLSQEPDDTVYRVGPNPNWHHALGKTTADTLRLSLPVQESFTTPGHGFDNRFFLLQESGLRCHTGAIDPPDAGTIMLDGATAYRRPYNDQGGSGRTDLLLSHFIDLSGYNPSDSLYLTFWYQNGGLNDTAEASDTLLVFFRQATDTNAAYTYFPMQPRWFALGGKPRAAGYWARIPLTDSALFSRDFQVRIENAGSLSGMFDCWHLDYFRLAANRTATDTSFSDASLVSFTGFIGDTASALPLSVASVASPQSIGTTHLKVRNLDLFNFATRNITVTLRVAYSETILATANLSINLDPGKTDLLALPALAFPTLTEPTMLELRAWFTTPDANPANDTLSSFFTVADGYNFSDGEPEAGFGLTGARGFGQRFQLGQPEQLRAVWMAFFPTRPYTTQFRLAVWDPTLPPDSLIHSSFRFPGSSLNGTATLGTNDAFWIRYALDSAIAIPAQVQVGAIQTSNTSLALGFDLNRNQAYRVFFDNNGNWIPSSLQGTLCLALELAGNVLVGTPPELGTPQPVLEAYPNPLGANRVLHLKTDHIPAGTPFTAAILDAQGRTVHSTEGIVSETTSCQLPQQLAGGVYHFWAWVRLAGGRQLSFTQRIMIAE